MRKPKNTNFQLHKTSKIIRIGGFENDPNEIWAIGGKNPDFFPDLTYVGQPALNNNVLVVKFNKLGVLEEKLFYDKNKMNKHAFSKDITDNVVTRGSFLESFLSSLRNKMRANSPRNKK